MIACTTVGTFFKRNGHSRAAGINLDIERLSSEKQSYVVLSERNDAPMKELRASDVRIGELERDMQTTGFVEIGNLGSPWSLAVIKNLRKVHIFSKNGDMGELRGSWRSDRKSDDEDGSNDSHLRVKKLTVGDLRGAESCQIRKRKCAGAKCAVKIELGREGVNVSERER